MYRSCKAEITSSYPLGVEVLKPKRQVTAMVNQVSSPQMPLSQNGRKYNYPFASMLVSPYYLFQATDSIEIF